MKRKILIIILIVLFIILGILASFNLTSDFDNFIYNMIISLKNDNLTKIIKVITTLANTKSIILYNVLIVIYILIKKNRKLMIIPINSLLSVIINNIFKIIFRRDRPLLIALIDESGYSYPSGHAMISILFFGTLSYVIGKSNIKYKTLIRISLGIFIILVGISRVYLGVHYVSDIIGGYLLGMITLLTVISIKKKEQ